MYAIALKWPQDRNLQLGSIESNTIASVQMLGVNENLAFAARSGGGTDVKLPILNPDTNLRWAWTLKITTK